MNNYTHLTINSIGDWFRFFANECQASSNIYFQLSSKIADNEKLCKLAAHARKGQPMPNLLFAAVHYLLLQNSTHQLAQYYPSIYKNGSPKAVPFSVFQNFCEQHETEIKHLLATKSVQTNAPNRCAYLMPIFVHIAKQHPDKELVLLDIGASAGLNLQWNSYHYEYSNGQKFGDAASGVKIKTKIRNNSADFNCQSFPKKVTSIGIDKNPVNLYQEETSLWLKALIWPDETERFKRLSAAIELTKKQDPEIIKAATIDEYDYVVNMVPKNAILCIYHTHALYQFTSEEKAAFWQWIDKLGQQRNELYYLAVEGIKEMRNRYETDDIVIELNSYRNRNKKQQLLALTDGHAKWVDWKRVL